MNRIKILPVLIIVSGLSFAVRLGEVFTGYSNSGGDALAQHEVHEPPPLPGFPADERTEDKSAGEHIGPNDHGDGTQTSGAQHEQHERPGLAAEQETSVEWRDAVESEYFEAGIDAKLFEDLAARRKAIDKREMELVAREALLKAAEQELEQKYRELQILRGELEALLERQSDEEEARIQSLVKIYEGMKSGDAARIFNSLDIDVLVEVMSRMSERKLAPILADMNPDRAQAITILLAQQKQLPDIAH